ncbi:GAF domain-containing protein [Stieleria sp. TO1_6]|uniref:GAF domain-containing protein n=1 Tax=Stieleria tagensis TaxID=2956795 RepID=UPI00209A6DB4|nr:GAF domain-containing protein [Stieleria tagensis]MCO8125423.1 GAF domain-containing protein [Stieleria tagensis]
MTTTVSQSHSKFLGDVFAIDVDHEGVAGSTNHPLVDRAVAETMHTGLPCISQSDDGDQDAVVMTVPVYRGDHIISLAALVGCPVDGAVGVMEVWQPVGTFDELSLTQGYFGSLERFQNVSSFVRFEKGSGLPGQVWRNLSFTVHDDLPAHPGFLRAAGASAESLQVAVGMPVAGDVFLASALLVSSDAAPVARGYEVWRCADDELLLESRAYQRLDPGLQLEPQTVVPLSHSQHRSLAALALESGGVVTSEDPAIVFAGRSREDGLNCKAVAIPFYEAERITNILTLIL